MTTITVCLPLRLVSELNDRSHWSVKAKRAAEQRSVTRMRLAGERAWPLSLPVLVTITRIGPRALDGDNLQASAKHVRDGVADALGVNDANPWVIWVYTQRASRKGFGVEIEVREVCR